MARSIRLIEISVGSVPGLCFSEYVLMKRATNKHASVNTHANVLCATSPNVDENEFLYTFVPKSNNNSTQHTGVCLHGEEVLEEGFADLRVEEATDAPELDVEEVEEVSE